jgi:hypothetical protein
MNVYYFLRGNTVDGYWRDAKIVNDHVYIGSEAEGHGVQIFDLKRLDHLEIPEKGLERGDVPRLELDGYVDTVGSSHNIVAFPEKQQILVVGYGFFPDNTACDAVKGESVVVLDVSIDPSNPAISCLDIGKEINRVERPPFALLLTVLAGWIHDAQCE